MVTLLYQCILIETLKSTGTMKRAENTNTVSQRLREPLV